MDTALLFTYGTLNDPERWDYLDIKPELVAEECFVTNARLEDYFTFKALVPAKGSSVYGNLWRIKAREVQRVDQYEGVGSGLYKRIKKTVFTPDGVAYEGVYTYEKGRFEG